MLVPWEQCDFNLNSWTDVWNLRRTRNLKYVVAVTASTRRIKWPDSVYPKSVYTANFELEFYGSFSSLP